MNAVADITALIEQRAYDQLATNRMRVWNEICDTEQQIDDLELRRFELYAELAEIVVELAEVV